MNEREGENGAVNANKPIEQTQCVNKSRRRLSWADLNQQTPDFRLRHFWSSVCEEKKKANKNSRNRSMVYCYSNIESLNEKESQRRQYALIVRS